MSKISDIETVDFCQLDKKTFFLILEEICFQCSSGVVILMNKLIKAVAIKGFITRREKYKL